MSAKAICLFVLLGVFSQTNAFSFSVKPVGTRQTTVTPGDVITYNTHITVSKNTPLSFHVSLPYFNTPIFSIEKFEILGFGSNLQAWKPDVQYSKVDASYNLTRSQLSILFPAGGVNRSSSPNPAVFADKIVIQVQSRVLKHNNVTKDAQFWLYYGMEYLSESVWVVGKSVNADIKPASARLDVKVSLPDGHVPTTALGLTLIVEIYHLPDSKSSATGVTLVLSTPSYLTYTSSVEATVPTSMYSFSSSGTTLTLTLSQPLEAGVPFRAKVNMGISVAVKGKFVNGHIYGDLQYDTTDEEACAKTVKLKQIVQMSFKAYAPKDTCDSGLTLTTAMVNASSQASLNEGPEKAIEAPGSRYGWRPWNIYAGSTSPHLVDNFLQVNFERKTTLTRVDISGTYYRFVKSFLVSYSQDSAFWKHVLHFGKPKEFEANTDGVNIVTNLFQPEIQARFLRIHVKKYYANGPSMHILLYGCTDDSDVPSYTAYQRAYLVAADMLMLCNVYPDRTKGKTNCYKSTNGGLEWNAMDPRIVNILGYASPKTYALGVTTSDTPVYMELDQSLGLRFIAKADWISVSNAGGMTKPIIIPLVPVSGNPLKQVTGTTVTVASINYAATAENLLKDDSHGNFLAIASWADYKVYGA